MFRQSLTGSELYKSSGQFFMPRPQKLIHNAFFSSEHLLCNVIRFVFLDHVVIVVFFPTFSLITWNYRRFSKVYFVFERRWVYTYFKFALEKQFLPYNFFIEEIFFLLIYFFSLLIKRIAEFGFREFLEEVCLVLEWLSEG